MNIHEKLEVIRLDSLNKARILRNLEGQIGNSDETFDIFRSSLADIYEKILTISWTLKREINPHAD